MLLRFSSEVLSLFDRGFLTITILPSQESAVLVQLRRYLSERS